MDSLAFCFLCCTILPQKVADYNFAIPDTGKNFHAMLENAREVVEMPEIKGV